MDPSSDTRAVSARNDARAMLGSVIRAQPSRRVGLPRTIKPGPASAADLDAYLAHQYLPILWECGRVLIATSDMSDANLAWIRAAVGTARFSFIPRAQLQREIALRFRDRLSEDAVFSLWTRMPELSARQTITKRQITAFIGIAAGALFAWLLAPSTVAQVIVVLMSIGFVVSTGVRMLLALFGRHKYSEEKGALTEPSGEQSLPVYTVLIPLYHEADVLPQLARALLALDYPRDKLDLKFVVEEDDEETCIAADALARDGYFEVIRVPFSMPRTKPKACNYALRFARGDYLVIYDAEDRPEADQLRKAVDRFRSAPRDTACLQARLSICNANDGWIARMFALDYAVWFNALLPGLDRLEVPMPLGGTSNHFRMSALRAAGAWDPFNVTEDADLGIRLAQLGYRVSMLDSTTVEEAPTHLKTWFKQRSRWLKGYMQTWLVHARHPALSAKRIGARGVVVFQMFIGGAIWSALVNPLLWLIFITNCALLPSNDDPEVVQMFACISGFGLLAANALLASVAMADPRRGRALLLPYGIGLVLFWMLISAAAYRALWQLIFKPFYWEKTPHGQTRKGDTLGG
ncbi:MAG: glycosyltransferase [Alphaproteobacteria bacterium]|nr:glycosyltransferase [Alphaproteobacteria bacterium]